MHNQGPRKTSVCSPVHDNEVFAVFRADRLKYQTGEGKDLMLWDVQAWVDADYNKLWFKSEGTWLIDEEKFEEAQTELFYSRNIASFWDAQVGIRHDFKPDPDRTFAAFGVQGLAPLWFEVEATAYVSEDGDVSAALEAEYDLAAQPEADPAAAIRNQHRLTGGR
jgi:copper resistance protein B